MIKKSGLVIHWLGFVWGILFFSGTLLLYLSNGVWAGDAPDRGMVWTFSPFLTGWLYNRYVSGQKSLFPWRG